MKKSSRPLLVAFITLLCLLPLAWLAIAFATGRTGANPVQYLEQRTGDFAIGFLLGSLACTPLKKITGRDLFLCFRKPLGLTAFFYAVLHLSIFLWLDYGLVWSEIFRAFAGKPFLWTGLASFLILLLLAVTSTRRSQQRLKKKWKVIHSLTYAAGILTVVHFFLAVKGSLFSLVGNYGGPVTAILILLLLLLIRILPFDILFSHLRGKIGNTEK